MNQLNLNPYLDYYNYYTQCSQAVRDWESFKTLQGIFSEMREKDLNPERIWTQFPDAYQTIFYHALMICSYETIELLIDEGVNLNISLKTPYLDNKYQNYYTIHPLWIALKNGMDEVAHLILNKLQAPEAIFEIILPSLRKSYFYPNNQLVLEIKGQDNPYAFMAKFILDIEKKPLGMKFCEALKVFLFEESEFEESDKIEMFECALNEIRANREKDHFQAEFKQGKESNKMGRI